MVVQLGPRLAQGHGESSPLTWGPGMPCSNPLTHGGAVPGPGAPAPGPHSLATNGKASPILISQQPALITCYATSPRLLSSHASTGAPEHPGVGKCFFIYSMAAIQKAEAGRQASQQKGAPEICNKGPQGNRPDRHSPGGLMV